MNAKNLSEIKNLQELFEDEKRWTQFAEARDQGGGSVGADSPDAVSFCLYGAVQRIYQKKDRDEVFNKLTQITHCSVIYFNDSLGYKEKKTINDIRKLVKDADV